MKTYEIKIVIEEGSGDFWEMVNGSLGVGSSGIPEVLSAINESTKDIFPDAKIKLVKFEDKDA